MSVPPAEVRRVAELAGLELSDDEVAGMARELAGILAHIEGLAELDASIIDHPSSSIDAVATETDPGDHHLPGGAELRADEPGRDALSVGVGALAPESRDGFVVVPRSRGSGRGGG